MKEPKNNFVTYHALRALPTEVLKNLLKYVPSGSTISDVVKSEIEKRDYFISELNLKSNVLELFDECAESVVAKIERYAELPECDNAGVFEFDNIFLSGSKDFHVSFSLYANFTMLIIPEIDNTVKILLNDIEFSDFNIQTTDEISLTTSDERALEYYLMEQIATDLMPTT